MTNSETIAWGTFIYILAYVAIAAPVSFYVRNQTKEESQRKENFFLAWIFALIAVFCAWLMWVCCFMHQMNPLVTPDLD